MKLDLTEFSPPSLLSRAFITGQKSTLFDYMLFATNSIAYTRFVDSQKQPFTEIILPHVIFILLFKTHIHGDLLQSGVTYSLGNDFVRKLSRGIGSPTWKFEGSMWMECSPEILTWFKLTYF